MRQGGEVIREKQQRGKKLHMDLLKGYAHITGEKKGKEEKENKESE